MPNLPPAPILRHPGHTSTFKSSASALRPAVNSADMASRLEFSAAVITASAVAFCAFGVIAWATAIGAAALAIAGEAGLQLAIAQYAGFIQLLTIG
jgi:hypothetical protein